MNKENKTTCKLLDLARQSYQRHIMIAVHLGEHFGIDYNVFVSDPLLGYIAELLSEIIHDHRLLYWWLRHEDGECFYSEKDKLGGAEIHTAQQLWNHYQSNQEQEG